MNNNSNNDSNFFKTNILSNKKKCYDLTIYIENNNLKFNCYYYKSHKNYIQSYSFEELQTIDKLFSLYNNINEIFDVIKDLFFNSHKIEYDFHAIEENEEENKFDIVLLPNLGKIHSIKIPLISKIEREKIKIDTKFLDELEEDAKQLDNLINLFEKNKKELADLKIENKNLKAQIEMNKINETPDVDIKKQKLTFTKNKLIINQCLNFHIEEFISNNKMEILKNWIINSSSFYRNKTFKFSLIYRATVDGDSAKNFHKNVDGNGPIIIIVKTTENKIIGGYTSKPWSNSNNNINDPEAFLFSFETFKMYKIIKSSNACVHFSTQGPCFGNSFEFFISDNCLTNELSSVNEESNCFNFYDNKNLLNNPKRTNFKVLDYEVYKLIF